MKSIIFAWIASSVSALRRLSIIDIGGSEDGVFSIVSEDVEYTDVSVEHTGCTADEVSCDGDRDQFWLNGVCHARLQLGQECVNTEESIGNVCMDALVCHEGICQAPPDEISCSKCSCAHCEQQMDREQRGSTDLLCDVSCIPLMMNVNETCADVTLAVTVTVIVENTKDGLTGRGSGSHTETKTIKKCLPCNLSSHDNNVMHTTQAIDQARAECNRTGYHAARSIATDLAHESAHDHGSVPTPPPKTVAETNPPFMYQKKFLILHYLYQNKFLKHPTRNCMCHQFHHRRRRHHHKLKSQLPKLILRLRNSFLMQRNLVQIPLFQIR